MNLGLYRSVTSTGENAEVKFEALARRLYYVIGRNSVLSLVCDFLDLALPVL